MKKILVLVLTVFTLFTLAACGDDTGSSNNEVLGVLNTITVQSTVNSDFTLVTTKDGVTITWKSDNVAIAVSGSNAIVTQGSNDVNVKLTATGTKGDETATKDYSVKVLKESDGNGDGGTTTPPAATVTTIAEALTAAEGTPVELSGVTVIGVATTGVYVTDGNDVMFMFKYDMKLSVGSVYNFVGTKAKYEGLLQVANPAVTSSSATVATIEPTETTIADLNTIDNANGLYKLTGIVKKDAETNEISFVSGDQSVILSKYTTEAPLALINSLVGCEVTINVFSGSRFTGQNWQVLFAGTTEDIKLSDDASVDAAINLLDIPGTTFENLDLVTSGAYGTTVAWTSSNESIISSDGVVTRPGVDTDVTLTATVTLNDVTKVVEFVVIVKGSGVEFNELFISEYSEGNKGSNRYIEIYNNNSFDIDLSHYGLAVSVNGGALQAASALSGTIKANSVYYLYGSQCDAALKSEIQKYDSAQNGKINFTGNDAVAIYHDGVLIDMIGEETKDNLVGDGWLVGDGSTMDHRLTRKPGVKANAVFTPTEWDAVIAPPYLLDGLGNHKTAYESKAEEVALSLRVPSMVTEDFVLEVAKMDATIVWSSDNAAITVNGANATLSSVTESTTVKLTAVVTHTDGSTFTIEFNVVAPVFIDSIAGILVAEDGATVILKNITVTAINGKNITISDGENTILCYSPKNYNLLEVGKVYNVEGVKGSYNNNPQVSSGATFTPVE